MAQPSQATTTAAAAADARAAHVRILFCGRPALTTGVVNLRVLLGGDGHYCLAEKRKIKVKPQPTQDAEAGQQDGDVDSPRNANAEASTQDGRVTASTEAAEARRESVYRVCSSEGLPEGCYHVKPDRHYWVMQTRRHPNSGPASTRLNAATPAPAAAASVAPVLASSTPATTRARVDRPTAAPAASSTSSATTETEPERSTRSRSTKAALAAIDAAAPRATTAAPAEAAPRKASHDTTTSSSRVLTASAAAHPDGEADSGGRATGGEAEEKDAEAAAVRNAPAATQAAKTDDIVGDVEATLAELFIAAAPALTTTRPTSTVDDAEEAPVAEERISAAPALAAAAATEPEGKEGDAPLADLLIHAARLPGSSAATAVSEDAPAVEPARRKRHRKAGKVHVEATVPDAAEAAPLGERVTSAAPPATTTTTAATDEEAPAEEPAPRKRHRKADKAHADADARDVEAAAHAARNGEAVPPADAPAEDARVSSARRSSGRTRRSGVQAPHDAAAASNTGAATPTTTSTPAGTAAPSVQQPADPTPTHDAGDAHHSDGAASPSTTTTTSAKRGRRPRAREAPRDGSVEAPLITAPASAADPSHLGAPSPVPERAPHGTQTKRLTEASTPPSPPLTPHLAKASRRGTRRTSEARTPVDAATAATSHDVPVTKSVKNHERSTAAAAPLPASPLRSPASVPREATPTIAFSNRSSAALHAEGGPRGGSRASPGKPPAAAAAASGSASSSGRLEPLLSPMLPPRRTPWGSGGGAAGGFVPSDSPALGFTQVHDTLAEEFSLDMSGSSSAASEYLYDVDE